MRLKSTFVLAGLAMVALSAPALAGGACGARCYQKVVTPAQYGTVAERVVVQPERTVHRGIPAVTQSVAEIIPEVTAVRHRTVMTRPAQVHESVVPAQYATHHRTVQVAPASASWQPIR